MKTNVPFKPLAAFAFLSCSLVPSAAIHGQDRVVIHGKVLMDEGSPDSTFEVMEVDAQSCVPLEVKRNGQFTIKLDIGERAYLRFEQEGYLTKEVLVDTKHANLTRAAARENRLLRFDVQMTPQLPNKELAYAGPVGIISFQEGTGGMKVQYDRSMVRRRSLVLNSTGNAADDLHDQAPDRAVGQE